MKTQQVIRKVAVLILSAIIFTACSKEGPPDPQTTNGWNSLHIDTDELPAETEVRIVLMEAGTFESSKATTNFLDYAEVKAAFHLAD